MVTKLGDKIPIDVVSPDGKTHQPLDYAERYVPTDELREVAKDKVEEEFVDLWD